MRRRAGWRVAPALCLSLSGGAAQSPAAPEHHLDAAERRLIAAMSGAARRWLATHQDADGLFQPAVRTDLCSVALTAMTTLALARTTPAAEDGLAAAVAALLRLQQTDGGIYAPARGLAVYTSGTAAAALREVRAVHPDLVEAPRLAQVELFEYRRGYPESVVDTASADSGLALMAAAARAARARQNLSADHGRALDFLGQLDGGTGGRPPARQRRPGWQPPAADVGAFTYEDLLPCVYRPLRHDDQTTLRAWHAIRQNYTLDRNPDLTHRYGPAGFERGSSGLYFYYCILSKTLAARRAPTLQLADGERHDWVRELLAKMRALQRADGSWVNDDDAWWEDEPVLVTSYALLVLADLRDMPRSRER